MSASDKITEYYPNQRHEVGFVNIWKIVARNVVRSKDLIFQLFKRDFTAQYKKSFLGLSWTVITPIFSILSWVLMQATGVLEPGDVGVPYPIYVLVGSTCWGLFINMMNGAKSTLSSAGGLVMQVKFPHEALLFKNVLIKLLNFAISFALILVVISFFGVVPSWKALLIPIPLIPMFFFAATIGLLLAVITIVAVDITNFMDKIMNFLVYTSPIIYSSNVESPILQTINAWNPMTYIVCSMRDLVIYGEFYGMTGFLISTAIGAVLFLLVWRAFYVSEDKLIERMI